MKRLMSLLLAVVMSIGVCGTAFAGQWTEDLHGRYYINDDGSYPTNKWQWIDDDGDDIAQCYYFDNSGYSVRNGKTPDGYETNMEGQWVIDGVVQQQNAAEVPVNGAQISAAAAYTGTPIVVLEEYIVKPSSFSEHYYIVQNTSNQTLDVSTSSLAYTSDGRLVAVGDDRLVGLGPGCVSVVYTFLNSDEDIARVDTTWSTTPSTRFQSVIQNLSYVENDINKGVIMQVTNNGLIPAQFVQGYVFFFKNGKCITVRSYYMTDDDNEIKPGATISEQFNAYEDFDYIEFYMTGRYRG